MAKPTPQEVYDYLMTKPGMTDVKAQGIIANIQSESLFDPGIRGDYMIADPTGKLKNKERLVYQKRDGKYYYSKYHPTKKGQEVDASLVDGIESTSGGLFQHQGSRYEAMVAEVGDDWETNWKGQIDFALSEPESRRYLDEARNFASVTDSTRAFMLEFEKPQDQTEEAVNKRVNNAPQIISTGPQGQTIIPGDLTVPSDATRVAPAPEIEQQQRQEIQQGLSNEEASPQDAEDYEYEVNDEEAKRVFGPTAKIGTALGKKVIVYTDSEGNQQEVDADSITEDTPDYRPPVEPYAPPVFEDQPSVQDRTQAPPVIEADPPLQEIPLKPTRPIEIERPPLQKAITPEVLKDREEIQEAIRDAEKDPRTIEEIDAERRAQEEEELRQERIRRAEAEEGDEEEIEIEEEEEPTEEFYPGTTIPADADPQRLVDEGFVFDREQGIYVKRKEEPVTTTTAEDDNEQGVDTEETQEQQSAEEFYPGTTIPQSEDPQKLIDEGFVFDEEQGIYVKKENITAPEGSNPGDIFTVDGKDYTVEADGSVRFLGTPAEVDDSAAQEQPSASLSLEEVKQIYGPNATITEGNGQQQIIVPGPAGDGSDDQLIMMSDAVAKRDNEIALDEEVQLEKNANILGLKRRDFKGLKVEDLNARLDQTTLSDEEKAEVRRKWTNANEKSILNRIYEDYLAGDNGAIKKAGDLIKSSGGVSSLVAGFIGAKAAKRGLEEVPVPRLEGLSTAFKQYSQQQKALAESGLSYAERQTLEQGIDQAYEAGIQNLVRGTGGDRAKFLAGTGALDFNRQTSLLKVAALEDEARRQNRAAYGELLKFEATQDRQKDIFTKSREYNQKLADKAMFQNTASAAFQHVFDNIRFGQDYKPLMDQMTQAVNRMGGIMGLTDQIAEQVKKNTERFNQIETPDPNDPNEGNEGNEENEENEG